MKRLVLKFLLALGLTVPVYVALTSVDPLIDWMYADTAWQLLTPLFHLHGAVGVEGAIEVVAGVLLFASFALALCLVRSTSLALNHRHAKRHPP